MLQEEGVKLKTFTYFWMKRGNPLTLRIERRNFFGMVGKSLQLKIIKGALEVSAEEPYCVHAICRQSIVDL